MHFDHIPSQLLPLSPPGSTPNSLRHPTWCSLYFFNLITHQLQFVLFIYFCSYTFRVFTSGSGAVHWSMVDLSGTTSLKKTDTSFTRSHQPLIALQFGCRLLSFLPIHAGVLVGLVISVFRRQPQLLGVLEASGPLVPRRCYFAPVPPILWLLQTSYSFSTGVPELWRVGMM